MTQPREESEEGRFAATLLFQYRVTVGGQDNRNRTCEKRMLLLRAFDAKSALRAAKERGRAAEHRYENTEGNPVHFEFVGVIDLLHLGLECEPDEVWYDIVTIRQPMERKETLVPKPAELAAIANERRGAKRRP
jgi:hypothetical protein